MLPILGSYEKAKRYIESHSSEHDSVTRPKGPCITISRQTGVGAGEICKKLVSLFEKRSSYNSNWIYFDKDLISQIIQDHELPERFRKFVDLEHLPTKMESFIGEILGTHPPRMKLLKQTIQTIRKIGEYGNSIIVGRGGNIILRDLPTAMHVRLIAPLNYRIQNSMRLYGLTKKQANDFIEQEDKRRKSFYLTHFHKDVGDPQLFHVVMNIDRLDADEIAEMIGCSVMKRFPQMFENQIEIFHR